MKRLELKLPPPLVALLCALAMWQIAPEDPPDPLRTTLALGLAGIGALFDLFGLLSFRRHRTTVVPWAPHRTSALVTTGIYRITRNPMYVGLVFILTGWAVYLGAAAAFLGPLLLVLYIDRFQIMPEERVLAHAFGTTYTAYAAQVRRWL